MNAETLRQAQWTTLADIESNGSISCIDGRHHHCIVGAPGGNIGELILVLSSLERLTNMQLTQSQLEQILANYSSRFGRFYMHTDQHAISALLHALETQESTRDWAQTFKGDSQGFFEALQGLSRELTDTILPLLLQAEFTGCGHLKLLLLRPDDYQLRKQLVEDTIKSFFRLMWLGNTRMNWEMLEGEHAEQQVVVIDADRELDGSSTVPYACQQPQQQFVAHSAARRFFHRRDAAFITNYFSHLNIAAPSLEKLIADVENLSAIQMQTTLNHLAADLPVIRVVLPGVQE